MNSLFANVAGSLPDELVEVLAQNDFVRIERIVSTGHHTADQDWYDQEEHEWVVVLSGEAKLRLEGVDSLAHMRPGDFVNIPAHQRHRVEWTSHDEPTVWLAVFYHA